MKFRNFLTSALMVAFASLAVVGCNENVDDPIDPDGPAKASDLEAVSLSSTSVGLAWTASTTSGVTYNVGWQNQSGGDTVTGISTTTYTVTGLDAGESYTFYVWADDGDDESDAVSVVWAPASRYNSDAVKTGIIRIYARSVPGADKGTGVFISSTGATNVSVASGPNLGTLQLVADVKSNSIEIGAPRSFSDFSQVNSFRNDVEVSDDVFEISASGGLDTWYSSESLATLFTGNNAKKHVISDQLPAGRAAAFAVRFGPSGQQNYARVMVVPNAAGKLVQEDTQGDEFVELRISYQTTPGLPYAKN